MLYAPLSACLTHPHRWLCQFARNWLRTLARPHNDSYKEIVELNLDVDEVLSQSFEAILIAVVIGAWTAFEVLATDLWITEVNARPMTLGVTALVGTRWSGGGNAGVGFDDDQINNTKETTSRQPRYTPMSLDILRQYEFNLGASLGTMIYRERKYNFNLLKGIKHAYGQTFATINGSACIARTEAKRWFSGEDYKKLEVLEILRHACAHSAGYADDLFRDRIKGKYEFSYDADGQIELDGGIVIDLANAAVRCAIKLLEGADQWTDKT
jgi:hypothetical protein